MFAHTKVPADAEAKSGWGGAAVGAVALFVGLGLARFAYSPLIPALVRTGWFGPATADFLASVNLLGYLIGAAVTGHWLAHEAPGGWLRAAMLVAAASLAACALPWGFVWYFLWRLLAGIAAGVIMVLAVPAILARVKPRSRGLLGGLIFGGVGCGIIFSGQVIPELVALGLPATWLLLSLLAFALTAAVWGGWSSFMPAGEQAAVMAMPRPPAAAAKAGAAAFALLIGAYCCNAIGFAPHSLFWVDFIARELGRGLHAGGRGYLLFGVGVTGGPLLAGWLGDRFGVRRSFACGLGLEAVGVALPLWSTGAAALAVSSLLVGAAGMGATTLASARTIELTAPRARTKAWGNMTLAFSIAYAGAGMGDAGLYGHFGRYQPIFVAGAAALVLGAVLAGFAG
ncbi:MAG: YbfB/YjiJ family MFS transporter [Terriglobales bacterium]